MYHEHLSLPSESLLNMYIVCLSPLEKEKHEVARECEVSAQSRYVNLFRLCSHTTLNPPTINHRIDTDSPELCKCRAKAPIRRVLNCSPSDSPSNYPHRPNLPPSIQKDPHLYPTTIYLSLQHPHAVSASHINPHLDNLVMIIFRSVIDRHFVSSLPPSLSSSLHTNSK